jgi:CelD/BcsL family acetyltransferase involved in cellulose biosynthesis
VPLSVRLDRVRDWDTLGARWRDLEGRTACSFFQSWTWIGCLARERFDRAVLLEATQDGRTVALALFSHRPGLLRDTLWLHEIGDPRQDSLFIEYNGIVTERDAAPELCKRCLTAALAWHSDDTRRGWLGRRLVLSGIDDIQLRACKAVGTIVRALNRSVPVLDLAALRRDGRRHLDVLSANTRAQLRRSLRRYERQGPLHVERAGSAADAHTYLDALAGWHQHTWQRRGRPGAFANPDFTRFHHALIDRALPRGEVELLRVSAGPVVIGYLYNFQHRGRVLAYQSGFDYASADPHQKPGLTCHHLAIERSLAESRDLYDFLAGGDRYKRSLANGETTLHWVTIGAGSRPAA